MAELPQKTEEPLLADAEVRRQLRQLCSSEKTRTVGSAPEHPHRWHPTTVRHPETGEMFNTIAAWRFITSCLENGTPLEILILNQPQGKKSYVMLVPGYGPDRIYIKLCFGKSKVIGRSFHLSNERERRK